MKRLELIVTPVAGANRHLSTSLLLTLMRGKRLDMVREPSNQYDTNAIRLDAEIHMVGSGQDQLIKCGYIPASLSPMISALIDHGYDLECVVDYVDEVGRSLVVSLSMVDISDV